MEKTQASKIGKHIVLNTSPAEFGIDEIAALVDVKASLVLVFDMKREYDTGKLEIMAKEAGDVRDFALREPVSMAVFMANFPRYMVINEKEYLFNVHRVDKIEESDSGVVVTGRGQFLSWSTWFDFLQCHATIPRFRTIKYFDIALFNHMKHEMLERFFTFE